MPVTNPTLTRTLTSWWNGLRPRLAERAATRPTLLQIGLWVVLLALTAGLSLHTFRDFQLGAYQDDADYVVLARSLVYAQNYGHMNAPGKVETANFPFGYPLILSLMERLWPGNLDAMQAVSLVATLLTISLLFWGWPLLSRFTSHWWGLAVAALYGTSPLIISQSHTMMSEPVFTCLTVGILLLTEAGQQKPLNSKSSVVYLLGLGALLAMLAFTRTIGLVFGLVVVARYAFTFGHQVWRAMLVLGVGGLVLTAGVVVATPVDATDLITSNARYVSEYLGFVQGTRRYVTQTKISLPNLLLRRTYQHAIRDVKAVLVPVGGGDRETAFYNRLGLPLLRDGAGVILDIVLLVGLIYWLRREGLSSFLLAVLLYYLSIGAWDWTGTRLLLPVLPELGFGLLLGIHWFALHVARVQGFGRFGQVVGRWLATGAALLIIVIAAYKSWPTDDSRLHTGDLAMRTAWIRANTPADAVVMTDQVSIDYLYSQRPTVVFPNRQSTPDEAWDYIKLKGIDYIVVAPVLAWTTPFTPSYNVEIIQLKATFDQLVQMKRLQRVNISPTGWTVTYQVVNP